MLDMSEFAEPLHSGALLDGVADAELLAATKAAEAAAVALASGSGDAACSAAAETLRDASGSTRRSSRATTKALLMRLALDVVALYLTGGLEYNPDGCDITGGRGRVLNAALVQKVALCAADDAGRELEASGDAARRCLRLAARDSTIAAIEAPLPPAERRPGGDCRDPARRRTRRAVCALPTPPAYRRADADRFDRRYRGLSLL